MASCWRFAELSFNSKMASSLPNRKRLRRHDANGEDDVVMLDHSLSWSTSSSSLAESILGVPNHDQPTPPALPVKREIKRSRLRRHDACEASHDMTLSPQSASSLEVPKQSTSDSWQTKGTDFSPQSNSSLDLPPERNSENKNEIKKDDVLKSPSVSKEPFFVDDWLNAIQL